VPTAQRRLQPSRVLKRGAVVHHVQVVQVVIWGGGHPFFLLAGFASEVDSLTPAHREQELLASDTDNVQAALRPHASTLGGANTDEPIARGCRTERVEELALPGRRAGRLAPCPRVRACTTAGADRSSRLSGTSSGCLKGSDFTDHRHMTSDLRMRDSWRNFAAYSPGARPQRLSGLVSHPVE
jgi:hypothetical protein